MKTKSLGTSLGWLTKSARYIFESPWHCIRQDQVSLKGNELTFTYMEHAGSVFVVPVTAAGRIVLIRTYRYNVDDWVWEVPAGGLGDKKVLSLENAARAELREETGYTGGTFERLGSYYSAVGVLDLKFTVFLARGVERTHGLDLEDSEQVDEVVEVSVEEAVSRARSGALNDGESALAVLLAAEKLR
ncbi:MAG: NUDIX domain-containing protein [Bdellovibrionota bacterium]